VTVLAIDPGTERSAWIELDDDYGVLAFAFEDNDEVLQRVRHTGFDELALELIQPRYGLMIGWETINTCRWVGRLEEAADARGIPVAPLQRTEVLKHLGVATSARKGEKKPNADSGARLAIIDRYGGPGVEHKGGPLAGVSGHVWQALAVAVTWLDTRGAA